MEWLDPAQLLKDGEYLIRVAVAMALAVPLGWNRERAERPAGLRTHMLVAAASATFIIVGQATVEVFLDKPSIARLDPLRSLEAVVTGLGFLAAGTIFKAEGQVKGLTTAASIWITASVALCIGTGRYVLGLGVTVLAMLVLAIIRHFEPESDHGVPEND